MTPASELLIARHGEAHCNRDGFIGGINGCRGLTEHGRHQIERLARRLATHQTDQPIHILYASPIRRATESARIIATQLGLDLHTEPALAEQQHGTADGRPWIDVINEYNNTPALHADQPLAAGGETWREYLWRSQQALDEIIARHPGKRVLILGHGDTIDTAFHRFFNLPASSRATVSVAAHHASLTVWTQQPISWTRPDRGWRWTLLLQNDTTHLTCPVSDADSM